ncbi:hypothetical protein N783_15165 [Pontibacillus marinus BH030004 = DSM 16465]|uniref:Uncharacterized protein n=1 Tax=Pontibacillus marinus BH030004 = DSM 16465 TaxID=1385511 RepID=A0A0A5FQT7_9BACI|nr:hypothetical protein N783_15165 [Pontibacillus marinus BH030004 = DSM 16465]
MLYILYDKTLFQLYELHQSEYDQILLVQTDLKTWGRF